jgi:hypothetical protein
VCVVSARVFSVLSVEDTLVKDVTTQLLFLAYTTKLKQY